MIRVMIVEDDPMILKINKKFLAKVEGFECVGESLNLKDAKDKILNLLPDLILLDVFFPIGKGIDLLKWLRARDVAIDAILITADKSSETVSDALRYGATDYLIKPFKFERFEEALLNYKKLKERLDENKHVDQSVIDQLTHIERKSISTKDTGYVYEDESINQTLAKVMEFIEMHSEDSFTAQGIAKSLGISRITARRYLDDLEKIRFLRMELEYGTVGRPKNIYYLDRR